MTLESGEARRARTRADHVAFSTTTPFSTSMNGSLRRRHRLAAGCAGVLALVAPWTAQAAEADLTHTGAGLLAVAVFAIAYLVVVNEEFLLLRKSKPVMVAAGIIWLLAAIAYSRHGQPAAAAGLLRENLLEYAELMLFLLSAMTYINTLEERNVFRALESRLVRAGFGLRSLYWLTGLLAFCLSPFADNLTTALVTASVALAVGRDNHRFVALTCINIVVAANAGGTFTPFGDITTLMVWQKGIVPFERFFILFIPALVNWLVPAALMAPAVPKDRPVVSSQPVTVKFGGYMVIALFLATIVLTVVWQRLLHLPPFLGMMTGLGLLKFYGHFIRRHELRQSAPVPDPGPEAFAWREYYKPAKKPFDIFISMKRIEWDTLMFFYGVVLCVGGLGAFGYLALLSHSLYSGLGATAANILIGVISAVIDNIPIMYAVLGMNPEMSVGQWLLITLTAGVGGSLLSIGSAAGVALMGRAHGVYTFYSHLRWSWAIALGYAASIAVHFLLNQRWF